MTFPSEPRTRKKRRTRTVAGIVNPDDSDVSNWTRSTPRASTVRSLPTPPTTAPARSPLEAGGGHLVAHVGVTPDEPGVRVDGRQRQVPEPAHVQRIIGGHAVPVAVELGRPVLVRVETGTAVPVEIGGRHRTISA